MTKPAVTYPDVEHAVVDYLQPLMDNDATVSVGVPAGWTTADQPHLEVALDGTPSHQHPMVMHHTVRLVARAASTTEAKRVAALGQGLLAAVGPGHGISAARVLTGVLAARDPETHVELASNTTRVSMRSTPIELVGS